MRSKAASIPYLIWMVLFTVIPLGLVVFFAFTDTSGNFTIANISQVGQYMPVLMRSIWLSLIATVICLVVAYPLAYIMSRRKSYQQRTLLMLVLSLIHISTASLNGASVKRMVSPSPGCWRWQACLRSAGFGAAPPSRW